MHERRTHQSAAGTVMEGVRSRVVERLDGTIRYDVVGVGPTTIVCWPGASRPLDDLLPLAEHLAASVDATVAVVQPRGRAGTTLPLGGHTLADLAGDVVAVIRDLGVRSVVLVGHAFGNRVMRMTATLRPDLIDAVVLLAAGGLVPPQPAFFDQRRVLTDPSSSDAERLDALRSAFFEPNGDPAPWLDHEVTATRIVPELQAEPVAVWWGCGAAPILVIQGGQDLAAPPANGEALLAEHGERVTLRTIEDAAHALPIERPSQCAALVAGWLDARPFLR